MKKIQIVFYSQDKSISIDEGLLVAPDIAAIHERHCIGFFRVKPSKEVDGSYEECGFLCDLDVEVDSTDELQDMPASIASLITWMVSKRKVPLAAAV